MKSFKNAFELMGDKPRAALLALRSDLMNSIVDEIKANGMTQIDAAKAMGVTQPRVSDLCRGKISRFSFDLLYIMNSRLKGDH